MKNGAAALFFLLFCGIRFAAAKASSPSIFLDSALAKPKSLGGAFTAVDGELYSLFFNPAGLGSLTERQVSFSYQGGRANATTGCFEIARPLGNGTFGFEAKYFDAGNVSSGIVSGSAAAVSLESDLLLTAAYGYFFTMNFSAGLTMKYLKSEKIGKFSSAASAIDFGLIFRRKLFSMGFALKNVGGGINYSDGKVALPLSARLGFAYRMGTFLVSTDFIKTRKAGFEKRVGAGCRVGMVAMRAGYRVGRSEIDGFSFGFGMNLRRASINYAVETFKNSSSQYEITATVGY